MRKKIFVSVAAILVACVMLTGCGFLDAIFGKTKDQSFGGMITSEIDGLAADSGSNSAPAGADYAQAVGVPSDVDFNTEEYSYEQENGFKSVATSPMSTFAADVDTASYSNLRRMIMEGAGIESIPDGAVRVEEMLNYFKYSSYKEPEEGEPFGVTTIYSDCPWNKDAKLLQIGLKTEPVDFSNAPSSNLTLLVDTSGSMYDCLELVKHALSILCDGLTEKDRVSIVTYAGSSDVLLEGANGTESAKIKEAIEGLTAEGSTNGAEGITTAYDLATTNFIKGGNNRVVLCTDGDFNVGIADESSLVRLIEDKKKSGVFLSVLGFGQGNISDTNMESLADHGNGNYGYIDNKTEARRLLSEELGAGFNTVAKDVKIQVEFNPAYVKGYRLIGYENRVMANEDFSDDTKDGGEIGSGHMVTALYEVIPKDSAYNIPNVDTKYSSAGQGMDNGEICTVRIRYKEPDGDTSRLLEYPVLESSYIANPGSDFNMAAAVAETGMLVRKSEYAGTSSFADAIALLDQADVYDDEYKVEFSKLVEMLALNSGESLTSAPVVEPSVEPTIEPVVEPTVEPVIEPSVESSFDDTDLADMETVDKSIAAATARKDYVNGDTEARKKIADSVLSGLISRKYISDLAYDEASGVFSFMYKNGVLGGWKLTDFAKGMN